MQSAGMLTFNWFTYLIGLDVCAKWLYSASLFFFFDFACSCVLQLHFGDLHGREQGIGVKCREHDVHGWCVYGLAMLPRHLHFGASFLLVSGLFPIPLTFHGDRCSPKLAVCWAWLEAGRGRGWMVAAVALMVRVWGMAFGKKQ